MKITTITISFFVISCLAIWWTFLSIKRDTISIRSGLVWMILWTGIGVFSLFPDLLNSAMRLAQMENRMFFILVVAVFILFGIVFNLVSRIDKMQRNISRLVQEIALINYKIEKLTEKDHRR